MGDTRPIVAILAGGRSSRFGRNKALYSVNGRPLLHHLVFRFRKAGYGVVVAGGGYGDLLPPDVRSVPDIYENRGPLGGIHAVLRHPGPADRVFVLPCDLPFFDPRVVDALCAHWYDDWALLLRDGFGPQPTCGIYSRRCLEVAEDCLRRGENIVWSLLWRVPHRFLALEEVLPRADPHLLFNLNSPEDELRFRSLLPEREHLFDAQDRPGPTGYGKLESDREEKP